MGAMSTILRGLAEGDIVEMCGPRGAFEYSPGIAKWGGDRGAPRASEHLILIGAGSGVAPMLQISNSVLANEEDNTAISMICCHKNLEEIIFRKELDEWAMRFPKKFSVRYTFIFSLPRTVHVFCIVY